MKASLFNNFVQWIDDKSLIIITKTIQEGKYKEQVEVIRNLIKEGKQEEADILKKKLPAFTPSGTFHNGRKADLLTEYSNHVILDIDKITEQQIVEVFQKVALIPHTFAAFISPSGRGIKIIVAVDGHGENHKTTFAKVSEYYESELQIKIDASGKDVSRLCFVSYDPNCYRNIYATPFKVVIENPIESQPIIESTSNIEATPKNEEENWEEAFGKCVDFTERKSSYLEGNRNNFIHLLACNCNRIGIPQSFTEELIKQDFDLDETELKRSVASAYKNNVQDFAKFANLAKSHKESPTSKDDQLMKMPFLPERIYDRLPAIMKEGCAVLKDRREKDIFITGAVSILSGCMRNVKGLYRGKEHFSNLFVFIIAPA
ncbi:MAG: BT4734/BF3469 family protein, partial [Ginsengibacter sp.]